MAISLSDFNKIWASTSPLTPYSFSDANYKNGWNFVGATPPARQMWDSYMKFSDEKQKYIVDNFLPLSGGTMTGNIFTNISDWRLVNNYTGNAGRLFLMGGNGSGAGASMALFGNGYATANGYFTITAHDGTNSKVLNGRPNGTLTWDGQPIQVGSDKRMKQDFADIPNDILEAWGKVEWQQFKYKADVKRKGAENCRFHVGLVAQNVKEVGEENNVDLLKYGILCHDEWEKDDTHEEAGDMWTVRYTEALCMEVAFLRKKLKALEEKLANLEK